MRRYELAKTELTDEDTRKSKGTKDGGEVVSSNGGRTIFHLKNCDCLTDDII